MSTKTTVDLSAEEREWLAAEGQRLRVSSAGVLVLLLREQMRARPLPPKEPAKVTDLWGWVHAKMRARQ